MGNIRDNLIEMILLSNDMILADIRAFQNRIQTARKKLAALPATAIDWKEHKKNKAKRREFESEISYVKKLIGYAKEALEEVS